MSSFLQENLLDHYQNPRNQGKPGEFSHSGEAQNRSCGDEAIAYVRLNDGKVSSINFEITGCALTVASASLLSEELLELTPTEIAQWQTAELTELVGELTPSRQRCAQIPLEAVQSALAESKVD